MLAGLLAFPSVIARSKRRARFAPLRCSQGRIRRASPLARRPRPPLALGPCICAHHAPLRWPNPSHRKKAPHLPAPSAQQTSNRPCRLQRPRRRSLRLPRPTGRPSPPRPPPPPPLVSLDGLWRTELGRRSCSAGIIYRTRLALPQL